MEVTKCSATSIAIHRDLLWNTAQTEPSAYDPKCSHIVQSDMKETVVNKTTTVFFKEMLFLQREPLERVSKTETTYLLYSWIL